MKRAIALSFTAGLPLAFILLAPPVAGAQAFVSDALAGPAVAAQTESTPKLDLFVGLGLWSEDGSTRPGLQLTGAVNPWRHVGFVGDLAFYNIETSRLGNVGFYEIQPSFMGGVRFYAPVPHATIFAQFLVGHAPLDDFALIPGLGVDLHLNRHLAVRAEADFKVSGDDGSMAYGTRFSTGIVVLLGRR